MKNQLRNQQFKSLLLAALAFMPLAASAQVEINEANFPDENFRKYLLEQDYGADGVITDSEIRQITYINVASKNISSLKGIEYFSSLAYLTCDENQLTSLDVSHNTHLKSLLCNVNKLTALDVSNCTALETLSCVGGNQLTRLDISDCSALTGLYCGGNQLTELELSNCAALTTLYCEYNQLSTLDVSNCTTLKVLSCVGNQLSILDISQNSELEKLDCYYNQLSSLNLSKNPALVNLICDYNQLTTLDISQNSSLTNLECSFNQLTTLDVSNNSQLSYLCCSHNMIKGNSMDTLIESLSQNASSEEYFIDLYDDFTNVYGYNTEGNVCTKDQVAAIKLKGWIPRYYNGIEWTPYEGSDDATNIMQPNVKTENANTPIYDLSGQRVNNLQGKKGVYIVGGKKVLVK